MVRRDWKGRLLAVSFCKCAHTDWLTADLPPSSYWHNIDWLMISSPPPRSTDWLTPQWSVCWSVGILSATSTRESKNFENWIGIKSESQSAATGPGKVTPQVHRCAVAWCVPSISIGLSRGLQQEFCYKERLWRSWEWVLCPCFQGQYFASNKKNWHRIHCKCLRNCQKICYQVSLIYHLLF